MGRGDKRGLVLGVEGPPAQPAPAGLPSPMLGIQPIVKWIIQQAGSAAVGSSHRGWLHISLRSFHPDFFDNEAAAALLLRP